MNSPTGPDIKRVAQRRLGEFILLDEEELELLERTVALQRELRRRERLLRQGDRVCEVYLLIDGWVGCSMEVDFDRHQLVKLHLPGDLLGLPNIALGAAASSLIALTPALVGIIPLERLAGLFETAPRLALTLFLCAQQERIMLMDHLAAVGQTSGTQRVCALLLHVHRRLKLFEPDRDNLIEWPLSQEHMAQGAGLTAIHVNRTLSALTRQGVIVKEGKKIRLLDLERLTELAAFPDRNWSQEPPWLRSVERVRRRLSEEDG